MSARRPGACGRDGSSARVRADSRAWTAAAGRPHAARAGRAARARNAPARRPWRGSNSARARARLATARPLPSQAWRQPPRPLAQYDLLRPTLTLHAARAPPAWLPSPASVQPGTARRPRPALPPAPAPALAPAPCDCAAPAPAPQQPPARGAEFAVNLKRRVTGVTSQRGVSEKGGYTVPYQKTDWGGTDWGRPAGRPPRAPSGLQGCARARAQPRGRGARSGVRGPRVMCRGRKAQ